MLNPIGTIYNVLWLCNRLTFSVFDKEKFHHDQRSNQKNLKNRKSNNQKKKFKIETIADKTVPRNV